MNSSASNQQVVALYESSLGEFSPEEIFEAMEGQVNLTAIKMALINGSPIYREKLKAEKEEFTKDEYDESGRVISMLMHSADSDVVRLRAAIRLRDEKKGRLDVKGAKNYNFNLTQINQEFKMIEAAVEKARNKTIDVDEKHKYLQEAQA